MSSNNIKKTEERIDMWRRIYSYVIPSCFLIVYCIVIILISLGVIDWNYTSDSKSFNNMLEAIITFVSIVIGVYGFLLPILLTNKKDCGSVEFFLKKADKKLFIKNLKNIVISGFAIIVFCSILFLNDILYQVFINCLIGLMIWTLLYFMCNGYRFISLLLSVLLNDKQIIDDKVVKDEMSESQVSDLNNLIKKQSTH